MSLSIMEAVSVEGLAETHGNGILQLCTTHFDHIDKKIIGMLQENARTPIKENCEGSLSFFSGCISPDQPS